MGVYSSYLQIWPRRTPIGRRAAVCNPLLASSICLLSLSLGRRRCPLAHPRPPARPPTTESVNEGHPDKLCDQVSDAILDACLKDDPDAKVACETASKTNMVMVFGEITTTAKVDYEKIVRDTVRNIGFTSDDVGLDADKCKVLVHIEEQ